MPQEEAAPCFIVIGIVMIVFDIIIIESTYIAVFGGVFLFLGIIISIVENNKKQQALRGKSIQQQAQPSSQQQAPIIPVQNISSQQQAPTIPVQNVTIIKETPRQHKFCPYCGKETSSELCPDCGKEID